MTASSPSWGSQARIGVQLIPPVRKKNLDNSAAPVYHGCSRESRPISAGRSCTEIPSPLLPLSSARTMVEMRLPFCVSEGSGSPAPRNTPPTRSRLIRPMLHRSFAPFERHAALPWPRSIKPSSCALAEPRPLPMHSDPLGSRSDLVNEGGSFGWQTPICGPGESGDCRIGFDTIGSVTREVRV